MTDLSGRIALITGASRGIGAAVAKALAGAGAHVILVARTAGGLEAVDDEIRAAGGKATLLPMDLLQLDEIDKLGPTIAERFSKLDILIANAGMLGLLTPLTHMKAADWQKVMDLNVNANFRLIRTLDPLLRQSDAGRVVFTSSRLAEEAIAYWGAYSVSKAALEMLVKIYATETENSTVRVNAVRPGAVETAMLAKAFPGGFPGQTVKPEDVAPAFVALASPSCEKHGALVDLSQTAA